MLTQSAESRHDPPDSTPVGAGAGGAGAGAGAGAAASAAWQSLAIALSSPAIFIFARSGRQSL